MSREYEATESDSFRSRSESHANSEDYHRDSSEKWTPLIEKEEPTLPKDPILEILQETVVKEASDLESLNVNVYSTKKTISQALLDVALLSANSTQLKYILRVQDTHKYFYLMLTLIISSMVLQVSVGLLFILAAMLDLNQFERHKLINKVNNWTTLLVFLITVDNVILSSFGLSLEPII